MDWPQSKSNENIPPISSWWWPLYERESPDLSEAAERNRLRRRCRVPYQRTQKVYAPAWLIHLHSSRPSALAWPIAQTRKSAARKHLRAGWFARRGIMSEKSQLWTLMLRINGAPHYADFKRKESESEGDTHSLIAFQDAASHEADVLNDGPGVSTVKKCVLWVRWETHADSGSLRKEKRKRRESAAPTGSLHTVQRR